MKTLAKIEKKGWTVTVSIQLNSEGKHSKIAHKGLKTIKANSYTELLAKIK